jgi:hypothetical protein
LTEVEGEGTGTDYTFDWLFGKEAIQRKFVLANIYETKGDANKLLLQHYSLEVTSFEVEPAMAANVEGSLQSTTTSTTLHVSLQEGIHA